jgi:hypothetical protein
MKDKLPDQAYRDIKEAAKKYFHMPNNDVTWLKIKTEMTMLLMKYKELHEYFVHCDGRTNTLETIMDGKIWFAVGFNYDGKTWVAEMFDIGPEKIKMKDL